MNEPLPRLRPFHLTHAALLAAVLAGCATRAPDPRSPQPSAPVAPAPGRDGPEANPPPDLLRVPDAEPRIEPVRPGGPNKTYEVLGQSYTPLPADATVRERGLASWYGRKFHGRPTASGELYNMYAMTAAHRTLPIPSYVRVRNPANAREVIVRVNDRGPFVAGRVIDLSYTAALKLGLLAGVAPVQIERITHDEIRSGAWLRPRDDAVVATAATQASVMASAPAPGPAAAAAAATAPMVAASPAETATPVPRAPAERAPTAAARGFWVQLGAYRERESAVRVQRQAADLIDWLAPLLAVFNERSLHRLQAGPYATRDEAASVAERIRAALLLVPVVVERR